MVFKLQGAIAVGKHADIVVWEPEVEFNLDEDHPIHFKHPVCSIFFKNQKDDKLEHMVKPKCLISLCCVCSFVLTTEHLSLFRKEVIR